jgi:hypothetical protein
MVRGVGNCTPPFSAMTIKEGRDRLKALKQNVYDIAASVIYDTERQYLDLNREQMMRGERKDGLDIGQYASDDYRFLKERMNPLAGGTVDLRKEGDFQDQMELYIQTRNKVTIDSRDSKNGVLTKKYSTEIFGLSPKSLSKYRQLYFRKPFMSDVRTFLFR